MQWVRRLSLDGLAYNDNERQISIVVTAAGEEVVIQYPGKESIKGKKTWKNDWDFRPKLINRENVDLTFEQIWDPLFDDLRLLSGEIRREVGSVLATLYYRIAYMVDYKKSLQTEYGTKIIQITNPVEKNPFTKVMLGDGPFWEYEPPREAVNFVARAVPRWAGMSFEAFLHYNSLLAWNEDMKCHAKFEDWTPGDPRGRINTLLTYIRVIGFILDEVRPSALLGGFARLRGMSMADPDEVRKICSPFVT